MQELSAAARWVLVAAAMCALGVGALVYIVDRPADAAIFFAPVNIYVGQPIVLGDLGHNLPTLAHAFALSVLTALLLKGAEGAAWRASLSWLLIDVAFEIGQHPAVSSSLAALKPAGLAATHVAPLANYFASGTFDPFDLLSIALGAALAYAALHSAARRCAS